MLGFFFAILSAVGSTFLLLFGNWYSSTPAMCIGLAMVFGYILGGRDLGEMILFYCVSVPVTLIAGYLYRIFTIELTFGKKLVIESLFFLGIRLVLFIVGFLLFVLVIKYFGYR